MQKREGRRRRASTRTRVRDRHRTGTLAEREEQERRNTGKHAGRQQRVCRTLKHAFGGGREKERQAHPKRGRATESACKNTRKRMTRSNLLFVTQHCTASHCSILYLGCGEAGEGNITCFDALSWCRCLLCASCHCSRWWGGSTRLK